MSSGERPTHLDRAAWRSRLLALHPRHFFGDTWRAVDREASEARRAAAEVDQQLDPRPWIAFSVGALCLVAMEYLGSDQQLATVVTRLVEAYHRLTGSDPVQAHSEALNLTWTLRQSSHFQLYQLAYWTGWRVLGYLLVPAAIIRWVFRQRLSEYGMRMRGHGDHVWLYGLSILIMLPVVALISFREDFAAYYPFYAQAGRSWADLFAWQALYAAQFVALEFFFRGFWLFSAKQAMGSSAIVAMSVPYCMIHLGKPWPEAVAAIVAGLVLGTLAFRTGSIWGGVVVHVSIALSMDVAALLHGGGLPAQFWPHP